LLMVLIPTDDEDDVRVTQPSKPKKDLVSEAVTSLIKIIVIQKLISLYDQAKLKLRLLFFHDLNNFFWQPNPQNYLVPKSL